MNMEGDTVTMTPPHWDARPHIAVDSVLALCDGLPDAVFDAIAGATIPIPGPHPAGRALRYTPLYPKIRQLRHEDDASVPMGEWERPLKKADWAEVAAVSSAALRDDSKDFQIAVWLADAWVRLYGVPGLVASLRLTHGLIDAFWESGFPCAASDIDARSNLFVWLSDALAATLTTRVALLVFDDAATPPFTLDDWQRMVAARPADSAKPGKDAKDPHTREGLRAMVAGPKLEAMHRMVRLLDAVSSEWSRLARRLDAALGAEAPSLRRVADVLSVLQRAALSLIDGRPTPIAAATLQHDVFSAETGDVAQACGVAGAGGLGDEAHVQDAAEHVIDPALAPSSGRRLPERIRNRDEAYALLKAVADYLQRHEPHSPTPYLIQRAISWGPKSLSELMREILEDEGELKRYTAMLGLRADTDAV